MATLAFSAPHHQAAKVGLELLEQGCHAVDAMIGAAAAITVAYPHMNSIGGDGFWLIQAPGKAPVAIDACGTSAAATDADALRSAGYKTIPTRGARACITMAGTVAGWQCARSIAKQQMQARLAPLSDILAPAQALAKAGIVVSESLQAASQKCLGELEMGAGAAETAEFAEFKRVFCHAGKALKAGDTFCNPDLASVFEQLALRGLDDFYRGELAEHLAAGISAGQSFLDVEDFASYHAAEVNPAAKKLQQWQLYNLPLPTQGIASLLILAIYQRLFRPSFSQAERVHYLIEASKEAFKIRDRLVCDPARIHVDYTELLSDRNIEALAANIGPQAQPWPYPAQAGDTVWMGCVDKGGTMVSFIQSVYWEFGSAIVVPQTGFVWNNRGASFSLDKMHHNSLVGGAKPFHTLNPAMATGLNDHTRVVYGTMGGEGQPQTQAAIFTRKFFDGLPLQDAINQDRWLLGRTWGESSTDLKLEQNLYDAIGSRLESFGHRITPVPSGSEQMGHAGAIIVKDGQVLECATDCRSDGAALTA